MNKELQEIKKVIKEAIQNNYNIDYVSNLNIDGETAEKIELDRINAEEMKSQIYITQEDYL